jgi:hypothetical protein
MLMMAKVLRIDRDGCGVVTIEGLGKKGYFDGLARRASKGGADLRPGSRVKIEADSVDGEVVPVKSVQLAEL